MNAFVKRSTQQRKRNTYSTMGYRRWWSTVKYKPISDWNIRGSSLKYLISLGINYEESENDPSI